NVFTKYLSRSLNKALLITFHTRKLLLLSIRVGDVVVHALSIVCTAKSRHHTHASTVGAFMLHKNMR
ncbi:hypothetical protein, partial [Bacteroides sp. 214]|uniref:hypothetical protein n=1 Tax=Bacteroides sp. 214 TaxID=2302935 RepID=UPI001940394F